MTKQRPLQLLLLLLLFTRFLKTESTISPEESDDAAAVGLSRNRSKSRGRSLEKEKHNQTTTYGVDVSFPIHHARQSVENIGDDGSKMSGSGHTVASDLFVKQRQKFYKDFVRSCRNHYDDFWGRNFEAYSSCVLNEKDRIEMSLNQPSQMTNYTAVGYHKTKTPPSVWALIQEFWNQHQTHRHLEQWGRGSTFTNHWQAPTYMVSLDRFARLKNIIWNSIRPILEEWTGQILRQTSLYGIRVYTTNAILATHVDRLPLITSAIINVAQDVDEPWPLEVYDHSGNAKNITMKPGDLVLYESHSILHGRPFPLRGKYMANIFIHFEPVSARRKRVSGGRPTERIGQMTQSRTNDIKTTTTILHQAAQRGDFQGAKRAVELNQSWVHTQDSSANGLYPLHEAARGGHTEIVDLLYQSGANLNVRSQNGATPLWWAKQSLGPHHELVDYLERLGAIDAGPEL